jgi:hypothetical protein
LARRAGAYGGYEGGPEGAAIVALAGAGLPKVAGTVLRAPPVQAYLIGRNPNIAKLAAALAAYVPTATGDTHKGF